MCFQKDFAFAFDSRKRDASHIATLHVAPLVREHPRKLVRDATCAPDASGAGRVPERRVLGTAVEAAPVLYALGLRVGCEGRAKRVQT